MQYNEASDAGLGEFIQLFKHFLITLPTFAWGHQATFRTSRK